MSLKTKRLLICIGCHAAVLALLLVTIVIGVFADGSTVGPLALMLVMYLITMRINPLPRIVEKHFIKEADCPYCGEVIDLIGNAWSCGCGFTSWDTANAFDPCQRCGRAAEFIVCPRCGGSLPC